MLINIPEAKALGQKEFEAAPAGLHLGRLYQILHVGTSQSEWQGEIKMENKIIFQFELHGEDDSGKPLNASNGKPFVVNKYYNLTMHEKSKLRAHLTSWLKINFDELAKNKEAFNFKKLLGEFAMVNVVIGNNGKTAIDSLLPVPAVYLKAGLPEGVNDTFMFEVLNYTQEQFEKLSQGRKEMVLKSFEYRSKNENKNKPKTEPVESDDNFDQEIPF
jgi:uncharacterized protein YdeI (YjbR/CyaY-like superfamily)